jgi:hypothetical protein
MHFYGWGRRSFMKDSNGQNILPQGENIEIIYDKDGSPRFYRERKNNLKTGIYYLRNKSATDAVKFTIQEEKEVKTVEEQMAEISCSLDDPDSCMMCSG